MTRIKGARGITLAQVGGTSTPPPPTGFNILPWQWGAVAAPAVVGNRWFQRTFAALSTGAGPGILAVGQDCEVAGIVVTVNIALVTDSIQITLSRSAMGGVFSDTAIQTTLPAGQLVQIFTAGAPVALARGDRLVLRVNQSGTEAQANLNMACMLTAP